MERFERRKIYKLSVSKYTYKEIKLLSYIFIFKTLIVNQLPDLNESFLDKILYIKF